MIRRREFITMLGGAATLLGGAARPGGNATGFMTFEYNLIGKWLGADEVIE